MKKVLTLAAICTAALSKLQAQTPNLGEIHGNFQADAQYYNPDSSIGAPPVPEKFLSNGFLNVNYLRGNFSAGFRYESYLNVMQGFDPRYKGTGIPYRYATYSNDDLEVTVGSFYEQFGNGLCLRTYEEKNLGIDNAFDGLRVKYSPYHGIVMKGLVGKQRFFFSNGPGIVRGFDGEANINEIFTKLAEKKTQVSFGGSFVSKYQEDQNPSLILPQNVGCWAGRTRINSGNISLNAEYAYKINDPSYDNKYIYKDGDAIFVNAAYSKKGMGILLGAKRVDNFSYKSDRDAAGNVLTINYHPALVKQHTYGMMAFHPYASQPNGEAAVQADLFYKFKKETPLGGKYGTDIAINFSQSNALDTILLSDTVGLKGYESNYFPIGEQVYFQDVNIEITKKISTKLNTIINYAYQAYNKEVIQGKPGTGIIYAHIGVVELNFHYKDESNIEVQLQHLYTEQEDKSWAQALVEWTPNEHWFVAANDQYNYGNEDTKKQIHYFNVTAGYLKNTLRIALGYGKTREGIFCVGGVCRYVPASNGITLSITSSF